MALKPITANMFDVKTMNGSWVMASTAGIESTANIMSVVIKAMITKNRGVRNRLPFSKTTRPATGSVPEVLELSMHSIRLGKRAILIQ